MQQDNNLKATQLSLRDLSKKNHDKLKEIAECAKKFKTNKIKVIKLLKKCKKLSQNCDITTECLKDCIKRDEFDEAETDMNKYFQTFQRTCRTEVKSLIEEQCGNDEDLIQSVKNALGYSSDEDVQYSRPCLAVFGQTKAGKSSLVNSFLEEKLVIQRETRCTARVTYLSHCVREFVAHTLGDQLQELRLNEKVNEQELELTTEDRTDVEKVKIEIRIGSTNHILESGIDVIDSPGLNENVALNGTCASIASTFLPIMIYVIDGRKGVTQDDLNDIQTIQSESPELKLIYFVTKLDRNAKDRKRKPKDEVLVAQDRLDNAYEKLVKYKLLRDKVKREECKEFHGASLWMVQDWQEKVDDRTSDANSENVLRAEEYSMRLFLRFQERILELVKEHLEYKLLRAVETLQITIEQLVEKMNNVTDLYIGFKENFQESLNNFKSLEETLHYSELKDMSTDLKKEICLLLEQNEKEFVTALKSAEYDFLSEVGLSSTIYQRPETLKQCQEKIRQLLEAELNRAIKKFVIKYMREKQKRTEEELQIIVDNLAQNRMGLSSFETMLQNRLLHDYEFYVKYASDDMDKSSTQLFMRKVFRPVKNIYKQLKGPLPDHKLPTATEWKEKQGALLLKKLNKDEFAKEICQSIVEESNRKHDRFVKQLKDQERVLENKIKTADKSKESLKYFVEEFMLLFMYCFEVLSEYKIQQFDFDGAETIGKGGQGEVRKCGDHVAKQVVNDSRIDERKCAIEVYFASRLNHPRLLQLKGIKLIELQANSAKRQLILYYDLMPGGDLKSFIEIHKPSPSERIQYAIEIAEGINVLHHKGIIHRDIKLQNILMKPNGSGYEAVIADYGMIKYYAWVKNSRMGTTFHMAPEMLDGEDYDHKVDTFSYGTLLWILISYKTANYDEYLPKMSHAHGDNPRKIDKLMVQGHRPVKRSTISNELYDLMLACWSEKANDRPSFEEIVEKLKIFKNS